MEKKKTKKNKIKSIASVLSVMTAATVGSSAPSISGAFCSGDASSGGAGAGLRILHNQAMSTSSIIDV